jgi:hypothetical protein
MTSQAVTQQPLPQQHHPAQMALSYNSARSDHRQHPTILGSQQQQQQRAFQNKKDNKNRRAVSTGSAQQMHPFRSPLMALSYRRQQEEYMDASSEAGRPNRLHRPAGAILQGTHQPQQRSPHNTSFLAIVLIKLSKVLPEFCHCLADDSSQRGASLACDVLDSTVATASARDSPSASAREHPQGYKSEAATSPLSLHYWIASSSNQHQHHHATASPTSSALALEGEWERYISPLLLLAGAEVLASDLRHLPSSTGPTMDTLSAAVSLTGLYQRIHQDLQQTQQVLCEPFLRSLLTSPSIPDLSPLAASASAVSTIQHHYQEIAQALSTNIQLITVIVAVRCQMIDWQVALFAGSDDVAAATLGVTVGLNTVTSALESAKNKIKLSKAGPDGDALLQNTIGAQDENDASTELVVEPLVTKLIQELEAWKFCLDACAALERCQ